MYPSHSRLTPHDSCRAAASARSMPSGRGTSTFIRTAFRILCGPQLGHRDDASRDVLRRLAGEEYAGSDQVVRLADTIAPGRPDGLLQEGPGAGHLRGDDLRVDAVD